MSIFDKKTSAESGETEKKDRKSAQGGSASGGGASMKDLYGSETKTKETKSATAKGKFGNAYRVLVKPLVTEKASVVGAENKYIFEVAKDANKVEVAKAINEVYGINPTKINIIRVMGKKARFGKVTGKRKDWKKAVITLPEGKSIKVYEGV